jgi:diacylglycerol O-acyltransferase / wax synthase
MPYERLSSQDATLLCAETPAAPLQIGAMCLFEAGPLLDQAGRLRMSELRGHIESRLSGIPRFRQRLLPIPFGQGRSVWVDDASFDIANHVRAAALPRPGGEAELRAFMAALLAVPLDRSRPLWEIWFVEGVDGDRIAVVPKVNHIMADGMAVLESTFSILDLEPGAHTETPPPWTPEPSPPPLSLLVDALVDKVQRRLEMGRNAVAALGHPGRLVGGTRTLVKAVMSTAVLAPKMAITRPVGPHRDFAWLRLPLGDLRETARTQGVTLNDVVLAVVAGALGQYLGEGPTRAGVRPRVLVPVSTRSGAGEVQNGFSMMVADLPPSTLDPLSRLRVTHGEMAARKASRQAIIGSLLFALGGLVTPWLLRSVATVALKRQPFVNLAVTNLPGTDARVYLLGSRLLELFPFVTVTGNIGLIIGVVSYNSSLGVGLTADADVISDLDALVEGIERSACELIASTGPGAIRSRSRTNRMTSAPPEPEHAPSKREASARS